MQKLKSLWNDLPLEVRTVAHVAWQVGFPVLVVHLLAAHSSKDVQTSFIAAGTVVLAVVKVTLFGVS